MATLDSYKLLKTLGTGAFSKVKLAEDGSKNKFALKIMKKYENSKEKVKGSHWDLFYKEVKALKQLSHPNILKLHQYSDKSVAIRPDGSTIEVIYMVLDYAEGGELFDFIAETGKFSEEEARYYFKQLISALDYIHSKGMAHRDIKPENILLDANFNLKLADFGFVTKDETSTVRKGTFGYMAPEVLASREYDCKGSDLFSASVLLFILASQHPPFLRAEPSDKYYKRIYDGDWAKFWEVHSDENFSEAFIDFITRMFSANPKERLSMKQIKEHPWFTGPVPTSEEIKTKFSKRKEDLVGKLQDHEKEEKIHHKKAISNKPEKKIRKFTQFFDVNDGDELIDVIVGFADDQGYEYEKSKEFFRITITVAEMTTET